VSPYNCTFTATFANTHSNPGFGVSAEDNGLEAAINYAIAKGIGVVTIDSTSQITNAMLTAAQVYPTVHIEDLRSGYLQYCNPQPTSAATSSTGAPAVRVAGATSPARTRFVTARLR
jgi:hypothetical protein